VEVGDDEELKRWEIEQMKKGVRGREVGSRSVELAMGCVESETVQKETDSGAAEGNENSSSSFCCLNIMSQPQHIRHHQVVDTG
jgi:hypothetical protein